MYRKERKRRVYYKIEPKPLVIKPDKVPIDDKSMVEDENVPVPIDTILLPKRRLPDLEFPDNLKYHTGYNCYLAHEKNSVRNNNIKYKAFFILLLSNLYNSSWFSYLVNQMWLHCLKVTLNI